MIPKKPKNVIWSDEQWRAIYERGRDVLINAGAGSGKTAVLTERIIEILKRGIPVERLIVLTFTKAAAGEMKERLRKRLSAEIATGNKTLNDAREGLDQAAIQTFDSFTLGLVRRFHYLLGVDRSLSIGDKVIFSLKKKQFISEIFEDLYREENPLFLRLIDLFAVKNDNVIAGYVYEVNEKMEMLADKEKYLNDYLDNHYNLDFINNAIVDFTEIIKVEVERIRQRLRYLRRNVTEESLCGYLDRLEDSLSDLLSVSDYQDFLDNIEVSIPVSPRKADCENERELIKYQRKQIAESIKMMRSYLQYKDEDAMINEILKTKDYAEIIVEIIKRLDWKMMRFKRSINSYSYNDIAKMAIAIFKENPSVCAQIKKHTYEILIDEYQDTNDLQEILISYIADNNVYMVGDIKQSIYRFRNANPDIFREKYHSFKEKNQGIAIDLAKNFRSRPEVIADINHIFSQIMTPAIGGVLYHDGHELIYGNKTYSENRPQDDYHLALLQYEPCTGYKPAEIEAFIIAADIKNKIKNGYLIYDKDEKKIRLAVYGDFTILAPEKRYFELYKRIFEYMQIPLMIHKDEGFISSGEIYVIKNILSCVLALADPDGHGDLFADALIGVLRSFVIDADDGLIAQIYHKGPLAGLKSLCPEIYHNLHDISCFVEKATTSEILTEIYRIFNIYEKIVKLGNVETIENKLNYLIEKFRELDKIGYCLADAVYYLDAIMKENLDIEFTQPVKLNDNVVNMMSIHKSKGLEFSVCYYADNQTRFKFTDISSRVLFSQDYGLILPVFDEGLKDTFYKHLIKHKYIIEEISERIRLFYVALTRAKEQIIIVTPTLAESYKEDNKPVPLADCLGFKSFFGILSSLKYSLENYIHPTIPHALTVAYRQKADLKSISLPPTEPIVFGRIKTEKTKTAKATAAVASAELLDRETLRAMEAGTKIHRYLEIIDFTGNLKQQIELIDEAPYLKNKIANFFRLPLFTDKTIIKTYHEHHFVLTENDTTTNGIIDLILETANELIVIDYKLSDIDKAAYRHQLEVYCRYLRSVSDKKISAYLYSIFKEELRQII